MKRFLSIPARTLFAPKESLTSLMDKKIVFTEIKNQRNPGLFYEGAHERTRLKITIGDFPEEPLYNLTIGDDTGKHEITPPKNWTFK